MCEMLGLSAKRRLSANGILRTFFSHAEQHPHGWGLARFRNDITPLIEKEPVKATESETLRHILDETIDDPTILAHIRFATVGTMEYANCHPFTATDNRGRIWTLVHNGTMFNGAELNEYVGIQYGDTDSERVLLHLTASRYVSAALSGKRSGLERSPPSSLSCRRATSSISSSMMERCCMRTATSGGRCMSGARRRP